MILMERLILQSDWDEVLKSKSGKIWIGLKRPDKESVYDEIRSQDLVENETNLIKEGFSAKFINPRKLTINYRNKSMSENINVEVLAPALVYSKFHSKKINCMDLSGGGLGVSCDSNEEIKVWTTDDGIIRRELKGHYGEAYCCKFFPSGIVVLTGGADTQLKVWSAETGACAATLVGHKKGISDLAFVERGKNVISTSRDGTVRLWDVSQSQCLFSFDDLDSGPINGCCLVACGNDYNLDPTEHVISEKEVLTEGKILYAACENKTLIALGLQNRKRIFKYECTSPVNCCSSISENLILCGTDSSTLHLIDIRKPNNALVSIKDTRSAILAIHSVREGCYIATGDGSCYLIDITPQFCSNYLPKCLKELTGPDYDQVTSMSRDAKYLYSSCRDGLIRKYEY